MLPLGGERKWPWRFALAGHNDFLYTLRPARCTGSSQCTLVFRSKLSPQGGARRSSPTTRRAESNLWGLAVASMELPTALVDEHGVVLASEVTFERVPSREAADPTNCRRPTRVPAGDQPKNWPAPTRTLSGHCVLAPCLSFAFCIPVKGFSDSVLARVLLANMLTAFLFLGFHGRPVGWLWFLKVPCTHPFALHHLALVSVVVTFLLAEVPLVTSRSVEVETSGLARTWWANLITSLFSWVAAELEEESRCFSSHPGLIGLQTTRL